TPPPAYPATSRGGTCRRRRSRRARTCAPSAAPTRRRARRSAGSCEARMRRSRGTAALLAAVAAVLALRAWPAHLAHGSGSPRLILFLCIDQMRYDYLTRFAPLFKGGFKRLLESRAVLSNALYR